MGRYKDIKQATAEVVGIRVLRKVSTEKAHAAIRDMIVSNPGLGVFAIRKIKKDTVLFSGDVDEIRWINADELPRNKALREFYERFAIVKNGKNGKPKRYGCPRNFHRLTTSWYINDPRPSEKPNVVCDENYDFRTLRDINEGEELTVDSSSYSDHPKVKPTGRSKKR